jgi:hypothetical protein
MNLPKIVDFFGFSLLKIILLYLGIFFIGGMG